MNDNRDSDIHTICGLWENTSAAGNRYMSGRMGFAKVMVFKVKNPKQGGPTHRLCITEWVDSERTDDAGHTELPKREGTGGSKAAPVADDDIPF